MSRLSVVNTDLLRRLKVLKESEAALRRQLEEEKDKVNDKDRQLKDVKMRFQTMIDTKKQLQEKNKELDLKLIEKTESSDKLRRKLKKVTVRTLK